MAQWLRDKGRMTWEDTEFVVRRPDVSKLAASMGITGFGEHSVFVAAVRPDVFSLEPTHSEGRINPCVHEVNVSRADFWRHQKAGEAPGLRLAGRAVYPAMSSDSRKCQPAGA